MGAIGGKALAVPDMALGSCIIATRFCLGAMGTGLLVLLELAAIVVALPCSGETPGTVVAKGGATAPVAGAIGTKGMLEPGG